MSWWWFRRVGFEGGGLKQGKSEIVPSFLLYSDYFEAEVCIVDHYICGFLRGEELKQIFEFFALLPDLLWEGFLIEVAFSDGFGGFVKNVDVDALWVVGDAQTMSSGVFGEVVAEGEGLHGSELKYRRVEGNLDKCGDCK